MRTGDFPMYRGTIVSCTYCTIGGDCCGRAVLLFAVIVGVICADVGVYGAVRDDCLLSAGVGVVLGWAVCRRLDWAICRA